MDRYIKIMKSSNIFGTLGESDIVNLLKKNPIRSYNRDFVLHFEGEICDSIDILIEGGVIIQRFDSDGNILTITRHNAIDTIGGNLLFLENAIYPMTIMTTTESKIIHLSKEDLLNLLSSNIIFLESFLQSISTKALILTKKIKTISSKSIRDNIINFINVQYKLQNSEKITLNMTKKELAERFGIQRTSLSRELQKMKLEGLIDYNSKKIAILDNSILK